MTSADRNRVAISRTATSPARLPAIVLPKTGDPSVLQALAAIKEHLEVMRGSRGNPWETVVTKRDLKEMGLSDIVFAPTAAGTLLVKMPDGSYNGMAFEEFADKLRATKLFHDLMKRLNDDTRFDSLPDAVKAILLTDLNKIAAERGADIQRVEQKIQDATQSLSLTATELTAAFNNNTAGVRQTLFAYADQNKASAGAITQVTARLNDFGGGTATVEETMTAIADRATGLEAQYTLKANAGGAFAAIGVAATENTAGVDDSYIIFVAQNFAFVKPTDVIGTGAGQVNPTSPGSSRIPFGIDSDGVIYLNGTVRINAGGTSLNDVAATVGIYVSFTSDFWKVDSSGTAVNTDITLTANFTAGLSGTVTWTKSGAGTTPPTAGSTNTWTIHAADQTGDACTYTATYTDTGTSITYTDSVTIVRLRDGSSALTGLLTNESHTVPASTTGVVSDYTGAGGTFKVYKGTTDITSSCTFAIASGGNPDGLTASINATTGVYSATASGSWTDASKTTTITLRATYSSTTIDKVFTLTKANTGATGAGGATGTRTAVLDMYQWAAAAPTTFPSGTSTYTWATASFTAPATLNSWTTTPGSPVLGQTLWVARQVFTDSTTAATSTVTWSVAGALPAGAAGVNGTRAAFLEVYKWSVNAPTTFPAGSSTYTWATATFTAPSTPNGWSLTPGAAVAGQTLWGCSVTYADTNTTATSTVAWTTSSAYAVGVAGTNGTNGTNGLRGSLTGYGSAYGITSSAWSDGIANRVISNMVNGAALTTSLASTALNVIGDTVTLSNGSSFAKTKYWSGTAWVDPGVVIDGNLLVSGTVSASVINGGTITASAVNLGSGAFQVTVGGVVTSSNFFGLNSQFGNTFNPSQPALKCTSAGISNAATMESITSATNTSSNAHAFRGANQHSGGSGLVGVASSYDFYAEGAGTNYGPFTGAHDALIAKEGSDLALVQGDIVVDVMCVARRNVSNTLFVVEGSTQPNQRGAIGVVATERGPLDVENPPAALVRGSSDVIEVVPGPPGEPDQHVSRHVKQVDASILELASKYDRIAMNGLGEGQLNVCGQGGNIRKGDLIVTSSLRGKGMKQADDVVRSYTVARAREDCDFDYADRVKMIACIYVGG